MLNAKLFFLFEMTNGKKKLGFGDNPQDALEILALRLTPEEMSLIIPDQYKKIPQRDLQKYARDLG
jgi:hypothetical protein